MNGWIKLHRKLIEWEWYSDINVCRVFLHIMLKASFKDAKWQGMDVRRGQLITSLEHLSLETGLSIQQVRTALNKLKSTGEITIKSTNRFTIVTVENYTLYQDVDDDINTQDNTPDNIQITNEQQTDNKQITTSKEVKEVKNKYSDEIEMLWSMYPTIKGKTDFAKKIPGLIKEHGIEKMKATIENYKYDLAKDKQRGFERQVMNGGTFVNGRYVDFMPENYGSKVPSVKQIEIVQAEVMYE